MLKPYLAATADASFPLLSHYPLTPDEFKQEAVALALERLEEIGFRTFTEKMIETLYWCELRPEYVDRDTRITSSSFPRFQGTAFISNKAMFHIPPNTLFEKPSFNALAENLFHEAIHQKVNLDITAGKVLTDNFDYRTSPKIFIHWRAQQEKRNQNWELDRAYHAACVYNGIIRLRARMLEDGDLEHDERKAIMSSLNQGRQSLDYLLGELKKEAHRAYFKDWGLEVISSLKDKAYV